MFERLQELVTPLLDADGGDSSTFCKEFVRVLEQCLVTSGRTQEGQLMTFSWAINLYKRVRPILPHTEHVENMGKVLFQACARTILDQNFSQVVGSEALVSFLEELTSACTVLLSSGCDHRFAMLHYLVRHPWDHPVLLAMVTGKPVDYDQALQYIETGEFPELFHLRVQLLLQSGCEDFALNLCNWCSQHSKFKYDAYIRGNQLILLYERGYKKIVLEECQSLPCCIGKEIVHCLQDDMHHLEATLELAQTFLVQDWLRPKKHCCTKELLHHWLTARRNVDEDNNEFLFNVGKLLEMASNSWQLMALVDSMHFLFGNEFIQFYMEVCILSIFTEKHNLTLAEQDTDMEEEIKSVKSRLGFISSVISCVSVDWCLKLRRLSMLTAFSLNPQLDIYKAISKLSNLRPEDHDTSDDEDDTAEVEKKTEKSGKVSHTNGRNCKYFRIPRVSERTSQTIISVLSEIRLPSLDPELDSFALKQQCLKILGDASLLPKTVSEGEKSKLPKPLDGKIDPKAVQRNGLMDKQKTVADGQVEVLKDRNHVKDKLKSLKDYRPITIKKLTAGSLQQGHAPALAGVTSENEEVGSGSAMVTCQPSPGAQSKDTAVIDTGQTSQPHGQDGAKRTVHMAKPCNQGTLPDPTSGEKALDTSVLKQSASVPAKPAVVQPVKSFGTLVLDAASLKSFMYSRDDTPLSKASAEGTPSKCEAPAQCTTTMSLLKPVSSSHVDQTQKLDISNKPIGSTVKVSNPCPEKPDVTILASTSVQGTHITQERQIAVEPVLQQYETVQSSHTTEEQQMLQKQKELYERGQKQKTAKKLPPSLSSPILTPKTSVNKIQMVLPPRLLGPQGTSVPRLSLVQSPLASSNTVVRTVVKQPLQIHVQGGMQRPAVLTASAAAGIPANRQEQVAQPYKQVHAQNTVSLRPSQVVPMKVAVTPTYQVSKGVRLVSTQEKPQVFGHGPVLQSIVAAPSPKYETPPTVQRIDLTDKARVESLLQGFMNRPGPSVAQVTDPNRKFFRTRTLALNPTNLRNILLPKSSSRENSPQRTGSSPIPSSSQTAVQTGTTVIAEKPVLLPVNVAQPSFQEETPIQISTVIDQPKDRNIFTAITPTGSPMAQLVHGTGPSASDSLYFNKSSLSPDNREVIVGKEVTSEIIAESEIHCNPIQEEVIISDDTPVEHIVDETSNGQVHSCASSSVQDKTEVTGLPVQIEETVEPCVGPNILQSSPLFTQPVTEDIQPAMVSESQTLEPVLCEEALSAPSLDIDQAMPETCSPESAPHEPPAMSQLMPPLTDAYEGSAPTLTVADPDSTPESDVGGLSLPGSDSDDNGQPPELTCSVGIGNSPALTSPDAVLEETVYEDTPPLLYDTQGNMLSATSGSVLNTEITEQNISGQLPDADSGPVKIQTSNVEGVNLNDTPSGTIHDKPVISQAEGKMTTGVTGTEIAPSASSNNPDENLNLGSDVDPTLGLAFPGDSNDEMCHIAESVENEQIDTGDIHVEAAAIGSYAGEEYSISQPSELVPGDVLMAGDEPSLEEQQSNKAVKDMEYPTILLEQETLETNYDVPEDDRLISVDTSAAVPSTPSEQDQQNTVVPTDEKLPETEPSDESSAVEPSILRDPKEMRQWKDENHLPNQRTEQFEAEAADMTMGVNEDPSDPKQDAAAEIVDAGSLTTEIDPENAEVVGVRDTSPEETKSNDACRLNSDSSDVAEFVEEKPEEEKPEEEKPEGEKPKSINPTSDSDDKEIPTINELFSNMADGCLVQEQNIVDDLAQDVESTDTKVEEAISKADDHSQGNEISNEMSSSIVTCIADTTGENLDNGIAEVGKKADPENTCEGRSIEEDLIQIHSQGVENYTEKEQPIAEICCQSSDVQDIEDKTSEEIPAPPHLTSEDEEMQGDSHIAEDTDITAASADDTSLQSVNAPEPSADLLVENETSGDAGSQTESNSQTGTVSEIHDGGAQGAPLESEEVAPLREMVKDLSSDGFGQISKAGEPVLFDLDEDFTHISPDADNSIETSASLTAYQDALEEPCGVDTSNEETDGHPMVNASTQTDEEEEGASSEMGSPVPLEPHLMAVENKSTHEEIKEETGTSTIDGLEVCPKLTASIPLPSQVVDQQTEPLKTKETEDVNLISIIDGGMPKGDDNEKDSTISPVQLHASTEDLSEKSETDVKNDSKDFIYADSDEEVSFRILDGEAAIEATSLVQNDLKNPPVLKDAKPVLSSRVDLPNGTRTQSPLSKEVPSLSPTSSKQSSPQPKISRAPQQNVESLKKQHGSWNGYKWVFTPEKKRSPQAIFKTHNSVQSTQRRDNSPNQSSSRGASPSASPIARIINTKQGQKVCISPKAKVLTSSPKSRITLPHGTATNYIVKFGPDSVTVRPQTNPDAPLGGPQTNIKVARVKSSPSPVLKEIKLSESVELQELAGNKQEKKSQRQPEGEPVTTTHKRKTHPEVPRKAHEKNLSDEIIRKSKLKKGAHDLAPEKPRGKQEREEVSQKSQRKRSREDSKKSMRRDDHKEATLSIKRRRMKEGGQEKMDVRPDASSGQETQDSSQKSKARHHKDVSHKSYERRSTAEVTQRSMEKRDDDLQKDSQRNSSSDTTQVKVKQEQESPTQRSYSKQVVEEHKSKGYRDQVVSRPQRKEDEDTGKSNPQKIPSVNMAQMFLEKLQKGAREAQPSSKGESQRSDEDSIGPHQDTALSDKEEPLHFGRKRKSSMELPVRKSSRPSTQIDSTASASLHKSSLTKSLKNSDTSPPINAEGITWEKDGRFQNKESQKTLADTPTLSSRLVSKKTGKGITLALPHREEGRRSRTSSASDDFSDRSNDGSQDDGTPRRKNNFLKRIQNSPGYIPETVERKTRFGFLRHPEREEQAQKKRIAEQGAEASKSTREETQVSPLGGKCVKGAEVSPEKGRVASNAAGSSFQEAYTSWFHERSTKKEKPTKEDTIFSQCNCHKLPSKYKCWNPKCSRSAQVINGPDKHPKRPTIEDDPKPRSKASKVPMQKKISGNNLNRCSPLFDGKFQTSVTPTRVIDIKEVPMAGTAKLISKQTATNRSTPSPHSQSHKQEKTATNRSTPSPHSQSHKQEKTASHKSTPSPHSQLHKQEKTATNKSTSSPYSQSHKQEKTATNRPSPSPHSQLHKQEKTATNRPSPSPHSQLHKQEKTAINRSPPSPQSQLQKQEKVTTQRSTPSPHSQSHKQEKTATNRSTPNPHSQSHKQEKTATHRSTPSPHSQSHKQEKTATNRSTPSSNSQSQKREKTVTNKPTKSSDKQEKTVSRKSTPSPNSQSQKKERTTAVGRVDKKRTDKEDPVTFSNTFGSWVSHQEKKTPGVGKGRRVSDSPSPGVKQTSTKSSKAETTTISNVNKATSRKRSSSCEVTEEVKSKKARPEPETTASRQEDTSQVSSDVRASTQQPEETPQSLSDVSDVEDSFHKPFADWTKGERDPVMDRYAHIKTYERPNKSKTREFQGAFQAFLGSPR